MRTNVAKKIYTHEGARAKQINPELQLRRSVMSCLLWENNFYEDGVSIADRIKSLIPKVNADKVASIAIEAREQMNLRHIPLLIVREMARLKSHKHLVKDTLSRVIQRPDELTEFLSIYWMEGRESLSSQVKKGLANAFGKFSEYQLAKYNRPAPVKLKDVLFLSHAKPKDKEQEELWKRLIDGNLETPDTWEVALSSGSDKKESWERLLSENKLGGLALLRNLRNMRQVGVNEDLIFKALSEMKTDRILPYRFISAAKYAPQWEDNLEPAMLRNLESTDKMKGKTIILVDVSGSMFYGNVSAKSDISFADAACGVAMIAREMFDNVEVFTFSQRVVQVPSRRGFALRDAIINSQSHGGTYMGGAINALKGKYDRLIVFTDEQSADRIPDPTSKGYIINVANSKNGVGYGKWIHIDGFSEACMRFIQEYEKI